MSEFVYRSKDTTKPVYHLHRDCSYLTEHAAQVFRVPRDNIKDRWRCCEECRYADIPALD